MKNFAATGLALAILLLASNVALAAANPNGSGQPGVECGDEGATLSPHGFSTQGFANAEEHYAGSDGAASTLHAKSSHAVSQYDIACYQFTQSHQ
jgi:hypothetical protein